MKVYLINIGCKVNFADLSQIKALLVENNYKIVPEINSADIILINTCAVTEQATRQSRRTIKSIKNKYPACFVGVLGCYAQIAAKEILEATGADAVFGINEKFKIHLLLKELIANFVKPVAKDEIITQKASEKHNDTNRTRAFLKLQDGCNYKCSYCIVPLARGASRSVQFDLIPGQIKKLLAENRKEIVVTGINLSDYKDVAGKNFLDLIKLLNNIDKYCEINEENNIRFRISSIEPNIINEELIEIIANSKYICPHFHIPLQSGNDKILQLMQRRYNTKQFRQNIELINKYMPKAFIGLDVISGFPTETEQDFETTKSFITSLNISALHCFTYSQREGTLAASMEQLHSWKKNKRTKELIELSKQKLQSFIEKNINKSLTVLSEKYDKENDSIWGYTENYIRVEFHSDKVQLSSFYPVKLTSFVSNNKGLLTAKAELSHDTQLVTR